MKAVKNAISYVIYNENRTKFLAVQRPADDADLPNVWGLPAGSVRKSETPEEALLRSGREKLGVRLRIIKLINEGNIERAAYILHMSDYEVKVVSGEPKVPQPVKGVTQYKEWKWATPDDIKEAARKGSLCSRLYLQSINKTW